MADPQDASDQGEDDDHDIGRGEGPGRVVISVLLPLGIEHALQGCIPRVDAVVEPVHLSAVRHPGDAFEVVAFVLTGDDIAGAPFVNGLRVVPILEIPDVRGLEFGLVVYTYVILHGHDVFILDEPEPVGIIVVVFHVLIMEALGQIALFRVVVDEEAGDGYPIRLSVIELREAYIGRRIIGEQPSESVRSDGSEGYGETDQLDPQPSFERIGLEPGDLVDGVPVFRVRYETGNIHQMARLIYVDALDVHGVVVVYVEVKPPALEIIIFLLGVMIFQHRFGVRRGQHREESAGYKGREEDRGGDPFNALFFEFHSHHQRRQYPVAGFRYY